MTGGITRHLDLLVSFETKLKSERKSKGAGQAGLNLNNHR